MSAHPTSSSAPASPCSQRLTCVAAVCSKLAANLLGCKMQDARNGMWTMRKTCMPKLNDISTRYSHARGICKWNEHRRGESPRRCSTSFCARHDTTGINTPVSVFLCHPLSLCHKERVRKVAAVPLCMEGLFGCIGRSSAWWKACL